MATRNWKALLAVAAFGWAVLSCPWPARLSAADTIEALKSRDLPSGLGQGSLKGIVPGGDVPTVPEPAAVPPYGGISADPAAPGLHAYFVNVGQGDAEYIELPNGKNALIDGGPPDPSVANGTADPVGSADYSKLPDPPIARFLTEHGVTKIDYVVLTHPHADHYSGLIYVFDKLQVKNFYDTRVDNSAATGDDLVREKARNKPGCALHYPAAGDELDWAAGVPVKVFNSCPNPAKSPEQEPEASSLLNNCSIALKLTYRNASLLFTGDIQSEVEERLVSGYGRELQADVLKVGHHGSAHSSSTGFLNMVQPKRAYIEVGRNDYGHPTQSALARLRAAGAAIYRTDRDGTQEYSISGKPQLQASVSTQDTTPSGIGERPPSRDGGPLAAALLRYLIVP